MAANNENAYDAALGGFSLEAATDDKTLLGRNRVIELTLDDIHEFALNPRRADNPLFAEIKASIASIGLQQPLKVTRRPDEAGYTLYDGGNTRLRALKQLWQESRDERYFYQRCHFVPYVSDADILLHHMVENEVRGEMTLLDKSLAVWRLKALYEQTQGKSLSVRELAEQLAAQGWSVKRNTVSLFIFTAQYLADRLPLALAAGMGTPRIETIRKTFHAIRKYVDERFNAPDTLRGETAQLGYLDHLAATDDADFAADCLDAALWDCCADIGRAFRMDKQLVHFELQQLCDTGTLYRSEPLADVAAFEREQREKAAAANAQHGADTGGDERADTGGGGGAADTGLASSPDTGGEVRAGTEGTASTAADAHNPPALSPLDKATDLLQEQIRHLRLRYPLVQRHLDEQTEPPFCIPAEHALSAIRDELDRAGGHLDPLDAAFNDEEAVLYAELTDLFAAWYHLQWDGRRERGENEDALRYWADGLQQAQALQARLQGLRPYLVGLHYGFSIHARGQEAQQQFARLATAIHDYLRVANREE